MGRRNKIKSRIDILHITVDDLSTNEMEEYNDYCRRLLESNGNYEVYYKGDSWKVRDLIYQLHKDEHSISIVSFQKED